MFQVIDDALSLELDLHRYLHENSEKTFLENIKINVFNKEFVFIVGMSGVGKTTLFDVILDFYKGNFFGNKEFTINKLQYNINELKDNAYLGYISQEFQLLPWLNIEENLYFPLKLNNYIEPFDSPQIKSFLKDLNLENNILKQYPHDLSYGMKARISLARILLCQPKFLFLDEFFTGIDTINNEFIGNMLSNYIHSSDQILIIAITHELDKAIEYADKIYVLTNEQELKLIEKPYKKNDIINILKQGV